MIQDNDPLADLIGGLRRRKQTNSDFNQTAVHPGQKRGLTTVDILALPDDQRSVVNWLSHGDKQASFDQIQQALGQGEEQLKTALSTLQEAGYVDETVMEGIPHYNLIFSRKASRAQRRRGVDDLWSRLDIEEDT